jgi:peptidoglycan-associated lipoprotein
MSQLAWTMIATAALLVACSSKPVTPTAQTAPSSGAPSAAAPAPTAPAPAAAARPTPSAAPVAAATLPPHLDPKSTLLSQNSVYFDFDEASIRPEFARVIELHGRYLMANPTVAVRVEGNADERGSAEYNLALGQRRAEAVRQALKLYGVGDTRVEAISWGEEKPKVDGHTEGEWAMNRRADLQYPRR